MLQEHAEVVLDLHKNLPTGTKLPPNVSAAFISLWEDEGFQTCFKRAFEYQLNDSAP
jgi:hypothetical protein